MNFYNKKMRSLTFGTVFCDNKSQKKAQGLSLSTVVIAALVLIVLIVLVIIFAGKLGNWNKTVESCPAGSVEDKGSKDACPGITLPTKIIYAEDGTTMYCCPKQKETTPTP